MTVALVYGGIRRQTVEVLVPLNIPYPDTFTPGQDNIKWFVVVSTEALQSGDMVGRGWHAAPCQVVLEPVDDEMLEGYDPSMGARADR